jgi:hypothetical protein
MTTNDFMKAILPVAGDIVKDVVMNKMGNGENNNTEKTKVDIDKKKSGIDIFSKPDKIVVNVNIYMNIYSGLGSNALSMTGKNYIEEY